MATAIGQNLSLVLRRKLKKKTFFTVIIGKTFFFSWSCIPVTVRFGRRGHPKTFKGYSINDSVCVDFISEDSEGG